MYNLDKFELLQQYGKSWKMVPELMWRSENCLEILEKIDSQIFYMRGITDTMHTKIYTT
jgi:hypothetical protein